MKRCRTTRCLSISHGASARKASIYSVVENCTERARSDGRSPFPCDDRSVIQELPMSLEAVLKWTDCGL